MGNFIRRVHVTQVRMEGPTGDRQVCGVYYGYKDVRITDGWREFAIICDIKGGDRLKFTLPNFHENNLIKVTNFVL